MKRHFTYLVFLILILSSCYVFRGPTLKQSNFLIHKKFNCNQQQENAKINKGNYYVHDYNKSSIDKNGIVLNKFYLIKFYDKCKIGFSSAYISFSQKDTSYINSYLKPQGYQWGMYHLEGDTIYIETRQRANKNFSFWKGVVYSDSIVLTHNLDKNLKATLREKSIVFKYVE